MTVLNPESVKQNQRTKRHSWLCGYLALNKEITFQIRFSLYIILTLTISNGCNLQYTALSNQYPAPISLET